MHLSCLLGTLLINVYEQSPTTTLADFTTSRPDSLLLAHSGHWLLWMSAVCQNRTLLPLTGYCLSVKGAVSINTQIDVSTSAGAIF